MWLASYVAIAMHYEDSLDSYGWFAYKNVRVVVKVTIYVL